MTDPTARNRLADEQSPYLRQHADNPVNWQPWDEAALTAARERDVPIFLSIGYSACHWCHVMEEESFEDEEVARKLNEDFVPIKVDREERPDVDAIYMTIAQLVSGQGGWPLSAWLTPEGEPFYVGTYFPREPRRGMPGFLDLLGDISDSWSDPEQREDMEERASQWTQAIESELEDAPEPGEAPDVDLLRAAADSAVRSADRDHGGFGRGQKFPHPGRIHLLLRAHERTGSDDYRAVATETLDAMVSGGLYDHVGGGFHRYCTDREWVVPHFEKMLYDNAEIPRALLAGYQVTGAERYAEAAAETFDFVERELTHPDGGFFSTLDARSEGEEGVFYVWTPEQVREAVEDGTDADLFCTRYGVTSGGNFEGGRTVLTESESVADLAAEFDLDESAIEERLARARRQAFEARSERPRPARDEKVLAGWNGLMINALAEGALVVDDAYADTAASALSFVREHLWDSDAGRLARRYKDGDVKGEGYLEDYAFLARGSLALYEATGEADHLAFALELARAIEAEFWDPDAGTLYFTPESGERLVARPQELTDQSTPSSAGVAASVLLALDHFADHDRFYEVAAGVVETHADTLRASPLEHAALVLAADDNAVGHLELTVVADHLPESWREQLAETYLPGRLLSVRPPGDLSGWIDALGVEKAPPIWAGRDQREGQPTVYACRSFTCSPPQTSLAGALSWAEKLAP
ncbi:MAG: thioredoxin domain-containing protein [Haloarculaceae archaeon]